MPLCCSRGSAAPCRALTPGQCRPSLPWPPTSCEMIMSTASLMMPGHLERPKERFSCVASCWPWRSNSKESTSPREPFSSAIAPPLARRASWPRSSISRNASYGATSLKHSSMPCSSSAAPHSDLISLTDLREPHPGRVALRQTAPIRYENGGSTMGTRKVALVTGASAGVGRATAVELARRGFDVALLARGSAGLEAAAAEVTSKGARALIVAADVSDYDAVDGAATQAEEDLGPLDVWVNNAMTTSFAPLSDTKPEDFRRAIEVTFLGQVWGTMAALARMRPRDRGNIVNVGSALAFIGIPLQSPYCAAKFACRGFFESTRAELTARGQSCPPLHGAPAGCQHPAVRLVPDLDGPPPSAGPAHLSAGDPGQIHCAGRPGRTPFQSHRFVEQAARGCGTDRSRVGKPLRRPRGLGHASWPTCRSDTTDPTT